MVFKEKKKENKRCTAVATLKIIDNRQTHSQREREHQQSTLYFVYLPISSNGNYQTCIQDLEWYEFFKSLLIDKNLYFQPVPYQTHISPPLSNGAQIHVSGTATGGRSLHVSLLETQYICVCFLCVIQIRSQSKKS